MSEYLSEDQLNKILKQIAAGRKWKEDEYDAFEVVVQVLRDYIAREKVMKQEIERQRALIQSLMNDCGECDQMQKAVETIERQRALIERVCDLIKEAVSSLRYPRGAHAIEYWENQYSNWLKDAGVGDV